MTPTGTAAAVITRKLGGNAASLTSYMILSNLATAIAAPLLFPFIHPMSGGIGFTEAFFIISQKVFPLLVLAIRSGPVSETVSACCGNETGEMAGSRFLSLGPDTHDRYRQNSRYTGQQTCRQVGGRLARCRRFPCLLSSVHGRKMAG